jgi:hypothetical protein
VLNAAARGGPLVLGGQLVLQSNEDEIGLEPALENSSVPIERLGRDYLADLDAPARVSLVEQVSAFVAPKLRGSADAAQDLRVLRDALRPRLPVGTVDREATYAAHVDGLWRIAPAGFYIKGWLYDRASAVDHLRLVSPEGWPIDLAVGVFRHPRPDVSEFFGCSPRERLGFIAYVEAPESSVLPSGWLLEVGSSDGSRIQVEVPEVVDDPESVRTMILRDLELERLPEEVLRTQHIRPALAQLEEARAETIEVDSVDQFGEVPAQPEVSLVIPLYREIEFVEYQMAQFVHDPEMREADLLYVLDSPEDADRLRLLAEHLFPLYRVPFRVATLSANGGFAVVNNLGAALARGRMLVLLNSDVLPERPGWLSRMVEFYDAEPRIGALAPKLLYEDDSIQHAGLFFDRSPGGHVWSNEHYFKGLHRDFPKANVPRQVPAVTGACLMTELALYREMDGLRGAYIRGDYEDSDLCLRLRHRGREIWYLPDVELYHLEGQSYPTRERALTSDYNKWLHSFIWHDELTALTDTEELQ